MTDESRQMTQSTIDGAVLAWSRFGRRGSLIRWGLFSGTIVFLAYAMAYLKIDLARILGLFGRVGSLIADRYYPPEVSYVLQGDYLSSVLETLQMAYLGGLFGILVAIPLAWLASYNMTLGRRTFYPLSRLTIMSCRSVHEMIWTILFVTILGFGVLSGVMALTMFCIGFAGKLFAEEIEAVDMGPVDALRSTGANELQVMVYAVWPQVKVAFTGIAIYTWDVAFRAATVVGFFGGGGMGWYLKRSVQQIESHRVAAILLSIIVLVVIAEFLSAWARMRVDREAKQ
jgi:phosphonate transport system permease protein